MTKINYAGSSKVIKRLCEAVNALIDGGGGGGSTVTVTPLISSGVAIAEITVNGTTYTLYAPGEAPDLQFHVDSSGNLIMEYTTETEPAYSIVNGDLIFEYNGTEPTMYIDATDGCLYVEE